ncbi:hypothetical protein FACS1894147_11990 [Spirochaetia bacterium]|nr:hypothetical protein FACS1894147_11990 [Spirochaetia bacterium]
MKDFAYFAPTEIVFGRNRVDEVGALAGRYGKKALLVTGPKSSSPVQISADHMDPAALKKAYGDKITFWGGGCDTQRILGFKDEAAVRENTRMLSSIFKPGGGFVFNQVHNIMGNVPPQNIVAMFDEAYKNSFYPERTL